MKLKVTFLVSLITFALFFSFSHADTYTSNQAHTQLLFKFHHSGVAYTYGRFNELAAVVDYVPENISESSIQLEVATVSIDVGTGSADFLDKELAGPDFFNSGQFPSMTFVSNKVVEQDDGMAVTGDLTLLGVTKEITVMVEKTGEGKSFEGDQLIGFHSEFEIDRTDFGMDNLLPASNGGMISIIFTFEGTLEN